MSRSFDTPVLLILFNRPDTTRQVFETIRALRPTRLFLAADGPRPNHPGDVERCAAARAVVEGVDWPCEVRRDYSDRNLGCRFRPQTAIDWVFSEAERAIVLEDDCLPHPTFWRFCEELLERYADDERVMNVSGTNVVGRWKPERQSYHFSLVGPTVGWASWRRAWRLYDPAMSAWGSPEAREILDRDLFSLAPSRDRRRDYDLTFQGKLDAWDYQWEMCRFLNSGLSVIPSVNLIRNLGFTGDATHTVDGDQHHARLDHGAVELPLRAPLGVVRDIEFERRSLPLLQPPFDWRSLVPERVRVQLRPLAEILGLRG